MAAKHRYLLALGSNMRHPRHGLPRAVIAAAFVALEEAGFTVLRASKVFDTAPVGPSLRRFANAATVVETRLEPTETLAALQDIEDRFGRQRRGECWRARVLDIDIVLWSGGIWASENLVIPHPLFRTRDFVLRPSLSIAPDLRDPLTGLTLRHLQTRLTKRPTAPR